MGIFNDMQYNFEYTNLASQRLYGIEAILKWHFLDHFTLTELTSYVNVSKQDGIQVNTTSPHAATASIDYVYNKPNYRLKPSSVHRSWARKTLMCKIVCGWKNIIRATMPISAARCLPMHSVTWQWCRHSTTK